MKGRIAVIGSGEYAGQIKDFIRNYSDYEFAGFIDNVNGNPEILCGDNEVPESYKEKKFDLLFNGIGYADFSLRKRLFEKFRSFGVPFATFVHPTAFIHCNARIGKGVYVGPHSSVLKDAVLEDDVAIMTDVLVSHNVHIKAHTYVAGMVAFGGYVHIGESCFIGLNSTLRDHVQIADRTIVGCGSNVIKDISESGHTYVGNPAVPMK